jgi:cytochrome c oxidase subunit 3
LSQAHYVVEGANLVRNEYGKLFADFFSLSLISRIPRFSGVIINIIIFFNVLVGTYEKRKSYEMVEKWSLLALLVWVFVFTVFYLV